MISAVLIIDLLPFDKFFLKLKINKILKIKLLQCILTGIQFCFENRRVEQIHTTARHAHLRNALCEHERPLYVCRRRVGTVIPHNRLRVDWANWARAGASLADSNGALAQHLVCVRMHTVAQDWVLFNHSNTADEVAKILKKGIHTFGPF